MKSSQPELDDLLEEDGRGEHEEVVEELEQGTHKEAQPKRAHQRPEHGQTGARHRAAAAAAACRLNFDRVAVGAVGGASGRLGITLVKVGSGQHRLPGRVECRHHGGATVPFVQVPQIICGRKKKIQKLKGIGTGIGVAVWHAVASKCTLN